MSKLTCRLQSCLMVALASLGLSVHAMAADFAPAMDYDPGPQHVATIEFGNGELIDSATSADQTKHGAVVFIPLSKTVDAQSLALGVSNINNGVQVRVSTNDSNEEKIKATKAGSNSYWEEADSVTASVNAAIDISSNNEAGVRTVFTNSATITQDGDDVLLFLGPSAHANGTETGIQSSPEMVWLGAREVPSKDKLGHSVTEWGLYVAFMSRSSSFEEDMQFQDGKYLYDLVEQIPGLPAKTAAKLREPVPSDAPEVKDALKRSQK